MHEMAEIGAQNMAYSLSRKLDDSDSIRRNAFEHD